MLAFVALRIGDQTPPRQMAGQSLISSLEYESSSCCSFGRDFGRWSYQRRESAVVLSRLPWDALQTNVVKQLDEAQLTLDFWSLTGERQEISEREFVIDDRLRGCLH